MTTKIKISNRSKHPLPAYETIGASGLDVRASLHEPVVLQPLQRAMIPTGLYVELPENTELQVRPRSGMAWKQGITCINTPGTIDADYRGEIKILLINLSHENQIIEDGDRVAQLVFAQVQKLMWDETKTVASSPRNQDGFGSTGKK